jgi:hypothetical protein
MSLHVQYTPKLINRRKRVVLAEFGKRFHSPFIFILWITIAFDYNDCYTLILLIPFLAISSGLYAVYYKYVNWYKDLLQIMESDNIKITMNSKIFFWASELFIQTLTALVSYWWVDDVHTCFPLSRIYQGYLFITVILLTFVIHVLHYLHMKEYTEEIVKTTYRHIQSGINNI